jgi:hypothetical protein
LPLFTENAQRFAEKYKDYNPESQLVKIADLCEGLILACEQHGAKDIQRRLSLMRRRFLLKDAARNFIKALTGHWGQRIYNKLSTQEWRSYRATMRSRKSLY